MKFYKILEIFWNFEKFRKFRNFFTFLKFWISWNFFENFEILWNFWNLIFFLNFKSFWKILKFWNLDPFLYIVWVLLNEKVTQTLFSFKKYMHPPLPYFKVNICPLPIPHFASIFFAYLWSFRWPNYIVTLPRYFSFRLQHLNIPTGAPSDELDKTIQRKWLGENLSHRNGYNHFRFALDFSYAFGIL
jgi:hypothetical protein